MFAKKVLLFILFTTILCYFGYTTLFNDYWGNPNEKSRIYSAVALIETGQFNFEPVYGSDEGDLEWPTSIDQAVGKDDLTYSDKFPLTVLLAVPLYGLLKIGYVIGGVEPQLYPTIIWFRIWYALIPFLLSVWFLYKLLIKDLSEEKTYLLLFIYTFATMNFSFSFLAMDHMISELLLILRIWGWKEKRSGFLVGLFAGLGTLNTMMLIPIDILFFIFIAVTAKDKKQIGYYLLGVFPSAIVYGIYHWALFGTPFTLSYLHVEKTVGIREPFYRITWKKIWGTFLSPRRGFFFYSSVFLFAIPGIIKSFKDKDESAWIWTGIILYYFIFNIGYREWHHGWTPGLRHFIPMIPVFILFLGREIGDWEQKPNWCRFLFITSVSLSVMINLIPKMGYVFYPSRVSNPHFWAGAYFLWNQYIFPLNFGMYRPFIKLIAYLVLYGGFIYIVMRYLIKAKITAKGIIAALTGILLYAGVVFMPLNNDTEGVADIYSLGWNSVSRGIMYYLMFSDRRGDIVPEFEENQEIADYASTTYAKVWLADQMIDWSVTSINWLEKNKHKESEWDYSYEQLITFNQGRIRMVSNMIEKHQLGTGYHDIDKSKQTEILDTINEYKTAVFFTDDVDESRMMYEYMFYGYLSIPLLESSWSSLQVYLSLKREWY